MLVVELNRFLPGQFIIHIISMHSRGFLKRKILIICLVMGIFSVLNCSLTHADEINININASEQVGRVPELFSSSIWIQNLEPNEEYALGKFLSENMPATVQLTMREVLSKSSSMENFKKRLHDYYNSRVGSLLIQYVNKYNTRLIVGFDPNGIPFWLSSRSGDKRSSRKGSNRGHKTIEMNSPPKSIKLWGEIVEYTMDYLYHKLKIENLGFYVGHEPDKWEWLGTEESFYKYYGAAARAVKKVDNKIMVGGIGVSYLEAKKTGCKGASSNAIRVMCKDEGGWGGNQPMLKNFIEYVGKYRIPIDFLNWHSFRVVPAKFKVQAEMLRTWLKDAGIDQKVYLYPSDWSYWSTPYPADYLDTEETAAYIIAALHDMWIAGIDWHGHDFDVKQGKKEYKLRLKRNGSQFIGDWKLLTKAGIVKPSYNAFKALTMLSQPARDTTNLLFTEQASDKRVVTFSTVNSVENEIRILISNFTPTDIRMFSFYLRMFLEKSLNKTEEYNSALRSISNCVHNKTKSSKKKLNTGVASSCIKQLPLKQREMFTPIIKAYNCFNSLKPDQCIKSIMNDIKYQNKQAVIPILNYIKDNLAERVIRVNIANLPYNGAVSVNTYTINDENSNSCKLNKKTESIITKAPCGINGIVDKEVNKVIERVKKMRDKSKDKYIYAIPILDKINNKKGVSLEGSKESSLVETKDKKISLNIKMKPNSVVLMVISKAE